jgi:3-phosphoshikimate 1-carboxyvinyltransferase
MKIRIAPSRLSGMAEAPPSKSLMQRAVAAALLAPGTSYIDDPSFSADGLASLAAAGSLGATIEETDTGLAITGGLRAVLPDINVMESGLALRLFTPIAAMTGADITLSGHGSLLHREFGPYEEVIRQLGGTLHTTSGRAPVRIRGPLSGGHVSLDGSHSSQFISGLLMAAPLMPEGLILDIQNPVSAPYIQMTLEVMARFGISAISEDEHRYRVPGLQTYTPAEFLVEGDWSGAAALLVAGALCAEPDYAVAGLASEFTQADSRITGALLFAGARVQRDEDIYRVRTARLRGFRFDCTDSPDLFPVLAALAAFCPEPTVLSGTHRLTHKESHRALTIAEEFAKAGIRIQLDGDDMTIHPSAPRPFEADSRNDHRIAMALSILAMAGSGGTIHTAEAVEKSFPDYWQVLRSVGMIG